MCTEKYQNEGKLLCITKSLYNIYMVGLKLPTMMFHNYTAQKKIVQKIIYQAIVYLLQPLYELAACEVMP